VTEETKEKNKSLTTRWKPAEAVPGSTPFAKGVSFNPGGLSAERTSQLKEIRALAVQHAETMLAELLAMAVAWRQDPKLIASSKGAAETVLAYAVGKPTAVFDPATDLEAGDTVRTITVTVVNRGGDEHTTAYVDREVVEE